MKIQVELDSRKRVLAGLEPATSAVVEVQAAEIPEDLRPHLVRMMVRDGAYVLRPYTGGHDGHHLSVPDPVEATAETVIQWLRDYQVAHAGWQATQDASRAQQAEVARGRLLIARTHILEAQAAGTLYALVGDYPDRNPLGYYVDGLSVLTEEERQEYESLQDLRRSGATREVSALFLADPEACMDYAGKYLDFPLTPEAAAEARRRVDANRSKMQEEEEASAARKAAQLADAVARLGTESQQARWAEGMLPTREAVDLVLGEALAPVRAVCHEIEDPTPEIKHQDECAYRGDDPDIKTDETVLTKLSAEIYALLRRVRAAVPQGATVEAVKITATCEGCKERASATFIRASWTVGEIEVSINIIG